MTSDKHCEPDKYPFCINFPRNFRETKNKGRGSDPWYFIWENYNRISVNILSRRDCLFSCSPGTYEIVLTLFCTLYLWYFLWILQRRQIIIYVINSRRRIAHLFFCKYSLRWHEIGNDTKEHNNKCEVAHSFSKLHYFL